MPQPAHTGPKPDKDWNDNMPVQHLLEVLPESSNLANALQPTAPPSGQTGAVAGFHLLTGREPYLFDADQLVLMGDLTSGGGTNVRNIVPLNGDLYVFGSTMGSPSSGVTIKWDTATRTWEDLADTATIEYADVLYAVALGQSIYFTYYEGGTDVTGVGVVDGGTGDIFKLTLPVAGRVFTTQVNNGRLVITGDFTGGIDVISYDPAAPTGTQFAQHSLPDNAGVLGFVIGSAGDFTYFFGSDATGWNLYSLNVETGAISVAFSGVEPTDSEFESSILAGTGSLNGDLYMAVYTSAGPTQILRADDLTGAVTVVITGSDDGVMWNHAFLLNDETDTSLWYTHDWSDTDKITQISLDGTIHTYDTNADYVYWVKELNGTLYAGASVDGVLALYSLNADGSLTFVRDFDGAAIDEWPIATIDDHLIVWTDSDQDGNWELWSSDAPSVAESWSQISPDDVDVQTWAYINVLNGDYLI